MREIFDMHLKNFSKNLIRNFYKIFISVGNLGRTMIKNIRLKGLLLIDNTPFRIRHSLIQE